jgi:2Fe-2S ferredoxin
MLQIVIQNLNNLIIDSEHSEGKVIELIHENGTDWMHACGKKGRCTTCKMIVVEGMENLNPPTDQEVFYRTQFRLKDNERLACQSTLRPGNLLIRVAEANKFPHIVYTE